MYNSKWAFFVLLLITNSIYNYVQHIFKLAGAFPYNQFVFILGQYTILNGHFLCYCSLPILYTTMYNIFFKLAGAFPYNQFVFILGQCTILNGHFLCNCSLPILYTTMYNIFFKPADAFPCNHGQYNHQQ